MLSYEWEMRTAKDLNQINSEYRLEADEMLAWCTNQDGRSSLLRIQDFPHIICVQALDNLLNKISDIDLNGKLKDGLGRYLRMVNISARIFVKEKRLFYGYGQTISVYVISVRRYEDYRQLINILSKEISIPFGKEKKVCRFEIFDKSISEIRKFLTYMDIEYIGIFRVPEVFRVYGISRISVCDDEYAVNWKDVIVSEDNKDLTSVYNGDEYRTHVISVKHVSDFLKTINMKEMIFDIECTSGRISFPKDINIDDEVFMISVRLSRSNSENCLSRNILLTTLIDIENTDKKWKYIEYEIRVYPDEKLMLLEFCKLIRTEDPDIIIGYNILNFDIPYIMNRLSRQYNLKPNYTRLLDNDLGSMNLDSVLFPSVTKESFNRGGKFSKFSAPSIGISGRLVMDNYPFIVDAYPDLKIYTLNNVSSILLGDTKLDNDHKDTFKAVNFLKEAKSSIEYLIDNGYRLSPELISEIRDKMDESYEFLRSTSNYCIKDSELSSRLFKRTKMLISILFQSKIYALRCVDILSKGKTQRSKSLMNHRLSIEGFVNNKHSYPTEEFEGGRVLSPICGKHNSVMVGDFTALYPSIIVKHNLCPSTYFGSDEDEINLNKDKLNIVCLKKKDGTIIRHAFVKHDIFEGITRRICIELLASRQSVKDLMKLSTDDKERDILNSLQNVIKITTNAIYGDFGAKFSGGYHPIIAASVTDLARQSLSAVEDIIRSEGCTIIYGDTDSIFYKKDGILSEQDCKEYSRKIEKIVYDKLGLSYPPEYPKFGTMIPITKKKYIIFPWSGSRIDKGTMKIRGNYSIWSKMMFVKMTESINSISLPEILIIIVNCVLDIENANVEDLVISQGYGSDNGHIGMFVRRIQDGTRDIKYGDKISYLVLDGQGNISSRMILKSDYRGEKLDYGYYIKKMVNISGTIIRSLYKAEIEKIKRYYRFSEKKSTNISGFFIGRNGEYEFDPVKVILSDYKKGLADISRYYLEIHTIRDILRIDE